MAWTTTASMVALWVCGLLLPRGADGIVVGTKATVETAPPEEHKEDKSAQSTEEDPGQARENPTQKLFSRIQARKLGGIPVNPGWKMFGDAMVADLVGLVGRQTWETTSMWPTTGSACKSDAHDGWISFDSLDAHFEQDCRVHELVACGESSDMAMLMYKKWYDRDSQWEPTQFTCEDVKSVEPNELWEAKENTDTEAVSIFDRLRNDLPMAQDGKKRGMMKWALGEFDHAFAVEVAGEDCYLIQAFVDMYSIFDWVSAEKLNKEPFPTKYGNRENICREPKKDQLDRAQSLKAEYGGKSFRCSEFEQLVNKMKGPPEQRNGRAFYSGEERWRVDSMYPPPNTIDPLIKDIDDVFAKNYSNE